MKAKKVNDSKEFMIVGSKRVVSGKHCGKCNCSSCGNCSACGGNCSKCQKY